MVKAYIFFHSSMWYRQRWWLRIWFYNSNIGFENIKTVTWWIYLFLLYLIVESDFQYGVCMFSLIICGFSPITPQSRDMNGLSKLLNCSESLCAWLCVSVIDWGPVHVYPSSCWWCSTSMSLQPCRDMLYRKCEERMAFKVFPVFCLKSVLDTRNSLFLFVNLGYG